jgi:mRNA interferase YafQ
MKIKRTKRFDRDLKRMGRQGRDIGLLMAAARVFASGGLLPAKYHDHKLKGDRRGHRECHVAPDWLLVYRNDRASGVLLLVGTGTHADLSLE